METIKSLLIFFSVGNQTPGVMVDKLPLPPGGTNIIFGSGACERWKFTIAIDVHFYFAFAPPRFLIKRVANNAKVDAEKSSFSSIFGKMVQSTREWMRYRGSRSNENKGSRHSIPSFLQIRCRKKAYFNRRCFRWLPLLLPRF